MQAEAAITSRNSCKASGVPTAAIRPMSQITVRWVSRSVVTISSFRPLAFSRATSLRMSWPDIARHQFAQPLVAEQAGAEQHPHRGSDPAAGFPRCPMCRPPSASSS